MGDRDPDLTIFVGIDSETDALPVGEERKYWARDALERLQPEIERAEAWAEQYGRTACQNILRRFGGSVPYAADLRSREQGATSSGHKPRDCLGPDETEKWAKVIRAPDLQCQTIPA